MDDKKNTKHRINKGITNQTSLVTTNLDTLVTIINKGGVIAYPTECVWGLGCNPWNQSAVQKILYLKKRSPKKGFILVGSHISQFSTLLKTLTTLQKKTLEDSWPGPHTWVIPDKEQWTPSWVRGRFDNVAVRVSRHPEIVALCNALMYPIISTSANLSGQAPLLDQTAVENTFLHDVDAIYSGRTGQQKKPTTIQDLHSGSTIRTQ